MLTSIPDRRRLSLTKIIVTTGVMNNYRPLPYVFRNGVRDVVRHWWPITKAGNLKAWESWYLGITYFASGCCECTWVGCSKPRTVLNCMFGYINRVKCLSITITLLCWMNATAIEKFIICYNKPVARLSGQIFVRSIHESLQKHLLSVLQLTLDTTKKVSLLCAFLVFV